MDIKIEKGVPAPKATSGTKKYPFGDMEVGDSFVAPEGIDRATMVSAANSYARSHGWKFSLRKTDDGLRVFRVA